MLRKLPTAAVFAALQNPDTCLCLPTARRVLHPRPVSILPPEPLSQVTVRSLLKYQTKRMRTCQLPKGTRHTQVVIRHLEQLQKLEVFLPLSQVLWTSDLWFATFFKKTAGKRRIRLPRNLDIMLLLRYDFFYCTLLGKNALDQLNRREKVAKLEDLNIR